MTGSRAGRPRDASIDDRAIAATLELLVDVGIAGTTMAAIAARAGLHASAIYRRWSSPIELIEEAIFPGLDPPAVEPTGDLRADLLRFLQAYQTAFEAPAARAAMPALLARQATGGGRSPEQHLRVSTRPQFADILHAAPDGTTDPDLDTDDVFDLLLGAIIARTIIPTIAARDRPLEYTVDLLVRMLRPTTDSLGP